MHWRGASQILFAGLADFGVLVEQLTSEDVVELLRYA
jgi:hypothetical protein